MAVSPLGNVNIINQNAAVASTQAANAQPKGDFGAMITAQNLADQANQIQEVRPPEQNSEVDEDREETKEEQERKRKKRKKQEADQEPQEDKDKIELDEDGEIVHLDISI